MNGQTQNGTENGTDIGALYDLWWDLHDIEKAIEKLRSGIKRALDNESLAEAIYYMVARDVDGAVEQENGLPNCVDNYLEYLLKMVEKKMIEVNNEIEQLGGEL